MDNPWQLKKKLVLFIKPKIEAYIDLAHEWRWRITASNGEPIGASTEGFSSKQNCLKNLKTVADSLHEFYEAQKEN